MIRKSLLLLAFLIGSSPIARADGNKFLQECQESERFLDSKEVRNEFAIGHCIGLIEGIKHTLMLVDDPQVKVCWPRSDRRIGITNGQAVRVVLSFLRNNTARLHESEVVLVILAFKDAYPCK